jgi:pimeloyl-ACP methyl ester carboxylesterase
VDTAERGRHVVVFFGGIGTSAGALSITEFARAQRDDLRLRFISVERNGFGATPFLAGLGFTEAVEDVLAVLARLDIATFSVVAISGGGPYAARLLARVPERLASVHLAAATSGGALMGLGEAADVVGDVEAIARDPEAFWEFPPESPVHDIPGFVAAARREGRRALGDRVRAAAALRHEMALLGSEDLPDLRDVGAPTFLYWGEDDAIVPLAHAVRWQQALGSLGTTRTYPAEGHDVQYLHWGDILRDIAGAAR